MISRIIAVLALAALAVPLAAGAQDYPNRPVRLIVAFAPGTTSDIIGRMFADKLTQQLGQPFVVENRTGAGGTIARRPGDQGGAGRLHTAAVHRRAAGERACVSGAQIRHRQGLRLGHGDHPFAVAAGGQPRLPAEERAGAHPVRKSESGQGELRLRRRRHLPPPHRREAASWTPASTCCTCLTRAPGRRTST